MGRITNQEPRYQSTHLLLQFNLHLADEVQAKRAEYTILVVLFASEVVDCGDEGGRESHDILLKLNELQYF